MSELENMMQKVLSSPEDMSRIMQLAQSLTGGQSGSNDPPAEQEDSKADPDLSNMLQNLMQSLSGAGEQNKTALISALKPYLRKERRAKVERAMKIAKIAKLASGALGKLGDAEHDL